MSSSLQQVSPARKAPPSCAAAESYDLDLEVALLDLAEEIAEGRLRLIGLYTAASLPLLREEAEALRRQIERIEAFEKLAVARDILRRRQPGQAA